MARNVSKSVKINITIREDLLEWADDYADMNGQTRSGLIAMALSQYRTAVEAMPSVNKLMASMAAVVEGTLQGEIHPDEASERMDRIQSAYQLMLEKK